MVQVIVIVDSEVDGLFPSISSEQAQQLAALKQAIAAHPSAVAVEVLTAAQAARQADSIDPAPDRLLCPLTFQLPQAWPFPGQAVYQACRDLPGLRQRVAQMGASIGEGALWLPIVLTAKGPLYAEVIGASPLPPSYFQPIHLSDRWRQPLYRLGQRLLRSLAAPPAVYLLQFGIDQGQICFDRLFPFPAAPALASLGVQTPDLFACHWRCLTEQPILDVAIPGSAEYQSLER